MGVATPIRRAGDGGATPEPADLRRRVRFSVSRAGPSVIARTVACAVPRARRQEGAYMNDSPVVYVGIDVSKAKYDVINQIISHL